MDVSLSNSTLVCCRCALISHLKDLRHMAETASTLEFRSICEDQINIENAALADINKYFKPYDYE